MVKELAARVTSSDVEWQFFRAGGSGGQNQNKTSSGCRVIHHPSGAIGESREQRSQLQNRRAAFRRMGETSKFQLWARRVASSHGLPVLPLEVLNDTNPDNWKIEIGEGKSWRELT